MTMQIVRSVTSFVTLVTALLTVLVASSLADDRRVVVLTSYPEELTARYQSAFEQRYPGVRLEILWRQSADALAYLLAGGTREVDVYWTPSPGNFARLRDGGHFVPLELDREILPGEIGGFPMADPDGYFTAFELAGVGIAYHADAVAQLGLEPPEDWADLANPAYADKVQIPIPSRTGFAPPLIEAVLQSQGWEHGWALLASITGQGNFFAPGAPGPDPLIRGDIAARLVIDFVGITDDPSVAFAYPRQTAFNPAHIAIFSDAPHPDTARQFVEFALSTEGQTLLLHPDVRRLPVRPDVYEANPDLPVQPFAADVLPYDGHLTQSRKGLVAALFDTLLVSRHDELRALWDRLLDAEKNGGADDADIRLARTLLTTIPMDEGEQANPALRALFNNGMAVDTASVASREASISAWRADLDERLSTARQLLVTQQP